MTSQDTVPRDDAPDAWLYWSHCSTAVDWVSWSAPYDIPVSIWRGIEQARRNEGIELTDEDLNV